MNEAVPATALSDGALTFLAPERLLLLAAVAALAIGYLLIQRRRSRFALRFSSVELFDGVAPDRPGWRRHLPAAAIVAGLAVLVVGTARPALAEEIPAEMATVIVALDASLSMQAEDVDPTRLAAAQDAADRFLDLVPPSVRVGLVTFSGDARTAVAPTTDRVALRRAIDRIRLGEGTAIGEAIYASLEELRDGEEEVPGGIVLLSDGETTVGRPDHDDRLRHAERDRDDRRPDDPRSGQSRRFARHRRDHRRRIVRRIHGGGGRQGLRAAGQPDRHDLRAARDRRPLRRHRPRVAPRRRRRLPRLVLPPALTRYPVSRHSRRADPAGGRRGAERA